MSSPESSGVKTERLLLRPLAEDDLDRVYEILSDEVTTEGMSWRQPTRAGARSWLARRIAAQRSYGLSMWAVEHRDIGELVGLCGFFPRGEEPVEIGYVIHAAHWRRGYASESVKAVVDAAHSSGVSVYATIRPWNAASRRVAEKAGLEYVEEIEDERGPLLVYASARSSTEERSEGA